MIPELELPDTFPKKSIHSSATILDDLEPEANKSTDSEADKEGFRESFLAARGGGGMSRPVSDRRSSLEAESRLDPGLDTEPPGIHLPPVHRLGQQPAAKKRPRELDNTASIAMNGDSSSDESTRSGPDTEQQVKKIKKLSNSSDNDLLNKPKTDKPSNISKPKVLTPVVGSGGSSDEFPRVGDLVWGRMAGFPFWPSFVTRSPQGVYKRELPSGKKSFHVQFFNWNDESGWVGSVLEFDGLDSFKKIAAKKKNDKSYNPSKGAMHNKWEKAAREAEETLGLTGKERLDQYLVNYGSQVVRNIPPAPKPSVKTTPKPVKKVATSLPLKPSTPKSAPAKKPKVEDDCALPAGWKIRNNVEIGAKEKNNQVFISPDGREFKDKASALKCVKEDSAASPVRYMKDESLPAGWRCQKIETSVYYFSPKGERFLNRDMVAKRLEEEGLDKEVVDKVRKGKNNEKVKVGPRSVMKRWRTEGAIDVDRLGDSDEGSESSDEEDLADLLKLPNGMRFRKGSKMDEFLDLDKLFDPSNGGMIEMVQLPDIFLEHPTVSVTESDNEMVISDVDTGEFIAKKIIYD